MSIQTFTLPDLGEGLTEAEVVRWLVGLGDVVEIDQAVVEVETAKSLVEVPSPYAGRVSTLHGDEGATIEVGKPLISLAAEVAGPNSDPAPPPEASSSAEPSEPAEPTEPKGAADAAAERYREEERAGSGQVLIGYGTTDGAPSGRRRRPRSRPAASAVAAPAGKVPRVISPLVRRLARESGLALVDLTGSGPGGLIMRRDVEAALTERRTPATTSAGAPSQDAGPVAGRTGLAERQRVPMSRFRKTVSEALSRSRREIPEATVWVDVDFTELFALRAQAKAAGHVTPGLLAYLARFTVAGLRVFPALNGEVDVERDELVQYAGVNLGLAVQSDRGLVVPAVLGADRLTAAELDTEIRRLTDAARDGKATPTELAAGTFTLNNYGAFRVDGSAAIVNHPQVAILGFGRIIDRPWVVDGELAVRKIGVMSFVFDHRVCDGGTAAGFMRFVADAVESPATALASL